MKKYFINMTNGIEVLTELLSHDVQFIRIQSTACEQKRWNFILQDLDNNFLLCLALGFECVIYDFSSKKEISRALYQGISWIEFVLNRVWFGREITPFVKKCNVKKYFQEIYSKLEKRTFQKIYYFKKFLLTDEIKINLISRKTKNDSNYTYYRDILKQWKETINKRENKKSLETSNFTCPNCYTKFEDSKITRYKICRGCHKIVKIMEN